MNATASCFPLRVRARLVGVTTWAATTLFLNSARAFGADSAVAAVPGESVASSVTRLTGALFLVIAIFLAGVWIFKNWQRFALRKSGGARLNVLETRSLGHRHAIHIVGYDQQRLLIASSPAGITMLTHLPEADASLANTESASATVLPFAFPDILMKAVGRK